MTSLGWPSRKEVGLGMNSALCTSSTSLGWERGRPFCPRLQGLPAGPGEGAQFHSHCLQFNSQPSLGCFLGVLESTA